jgi:hypothetical protein
MYKNNSLVTGLFRGYYSLINYLFNSIFMPVYGYYSYTKRYRQADINRTIIKTKMKNY